MNETSKQSKVIIAIIFVGLLISASLVFVGWQTRQSATGVDETKLAQKVKDELLAELQNGELLSQQIDAGIERFVQKQREAQIKAQEERERLAQEKAKNVRRVSAERDHIYGNPEAVITLIEYSDFECPFCKQFHPIPKEVVEAFDGKVNWVYRHYPLAFHNPGAQKQAEATECANELGGNEAFWKYADLIYERTTSNGQGFPIEALIPLAEEIGLDKEQFQACLESEKYAERVQEDLTEGATSGISGTPGSILLNNKTGEVRLKSGALPFEALKTDIEEMLKS